MRWAAGLLYVSTGLLTGYAALYQMMQTVNGGPWSWCYPVMIAASVLVLVSGVHFTVPKLDPIWLAAIAAAIPIAVCTFFGRIPGRCWAFAAIIAMITWACFTFIGGARRQSLPALIANGVLLTSWIPSSATTIYAYMTLNSPSMTARALLPLIVFWVFLLAAMMISGVLFFRTPQP